MVDYHWKYQDGISLMRLELQILEAISESGSPIIGVAYERLIFMASGMGVRVDHKELASQITHCW